jgi:LysM repeat protein
MGVESNVEAGVKYLAELIRRFGREDYAVAAYNGGPTRVARSAPMPLETLQYVFGVGHYRATLKQHHAAIRHYAARLQIAEATAGEDWWTLSRRLQVPLLQLRFHNAFLAHRPLRPGWIVAYPPTPRTNLLTNQNGVILYKTRHGDNYFNVASAMGVDVETLRAENELWRLQWLSAGMRLRIPLPPPPATSIRYRVRAGETLDIIGQRARIDPWRLIRDNHLFEAEHVTPGTMLALSGAPVAPSPRSTGITQHRVQRGDTLFGLARRYQTTVDSIQQVNGLKRGSTLRAGERLLIPGSAPASVAGAIP